MTLTRDDQQAFLQQLVAEGGRVAGHCNAIAGKSCHHHMLNDLTALTFMAKMHAQGFDVSLEEAEGCIERIRIVGETGQYPDHLLLAAKLRLSPLSA